MKPPRQHPQELILGLVSVLETSCDATYDDKTVSTLERWFRDNLTTPVTAHKRVIPNQRFVIEKTLRELVDIIGCDLVITTGAIGPTRHDQVPESTLAVATRSLAGLADLLRRHTADSVLSRPQAVLRDTPEQTSLIVNIDNDPGITDAFDSDKGEANSLFSSIRRCLQQVGGPEIDTVRPCAPETPLADSSSPATTAVSAESPDNKPTASTEEPGETATPAFHPDDLLTVTPNHTRLPADMTVIWMHGMGADNTDFADFPNRIVELGGPVCRFILPNAPVREISAHPGYPMRAWYDVFSDRFDDKEDQSGIEDTALKISRLITDLEALGIPRHRIVLGGFSQGAAMALYTGLRQKRALGGIIALSGYVPLAVELFNNASPAARETPIFMAHGNYDSVIAPYIAHRGARLIEELAPRLVWRTYDMDHEVRQEELADIVLFMNALA